MEAIEINESEVTITWTAVVTVVSTLLLVAIIFFRAKITKSNKQKNIPPHVPSTLPFLGCAVEFGKNPISFLLEAHKKYGSVFSITMVGKTFTYLIGSDSSALFFNSRNNDLNAEEVYSRLVTPVFGKGVCYDVPHNIFLEQKKMLKYGLSIAHFKRYIPLIRKETEDYFQRWGKTGQKDLFVALSELIIMTASRCLHGREIRSMLNERIAQLYTDLDGGFSHAAWLLPGWLPLPSFRRRDRARQEMEKTFTSVINKRRNSPDEEYEDDILNFLINTTYKDGRSLTDSEIAGLLIGLLMAGQHTSSSTSSWLGFFIAQQKDIQEKAYQEILDVCGDDLSTLNYDQLKDLSFLECCIRETLRLHPPIMTMMRMAKTHQVVDGYTIPAGHQVCVSPTVNHRLTESWTDSNTFKPDRFLQTEGINNTDKFAYVPFGAGRHRCIGEGFAYVQIKTIWTVLLQKYEFDLVDGYFPVVNYQTMIHTPTNPIISYKCRS